MIYIVFPTGSFHGWGNCGKYITRELSAITDIKLVPVNFSEKNIANPLDYHFLKSKLIEKQEYEALKNSALKLDFSVLQAITSQEMLPVEPDIKGKFNAGYSFFEENILLPEYINNAKEHFDIVIAGCKWCEEVLRSYNLENVSTVIQGIDPQIFNPCDNEKKYLKDKFVIFSGGKFELRKGQDLVIKAFKVLQDKYKDVILVNSWFNMWQNSLKTMAASPYINFSIKSNEYTSMINHVLSDNGINLGNVITLLPAPNSSMAHIYKNTDIGLFPNRCEGGTNLVLMEYMACGKPVIASYNTGHKDIITSQNSIMIQKMQQSRINNGQRDIAIWETPDFDEIIAHLEWAYNNREKLNAIGNQAGSDLSQLTWTKSAENFRDILSTAV